MSTSAMTTAKCAWAINAYGGPKQMQLRGASSTGARSARRADPHASRRDR